MFIPDVKQHSYFNAEEQQWFYEAYFINEEETTIILVREKSKEFDVLGALLAHTKLDVYINIRNYYD